MDTTPRRDDGSSEPDSSALDGYRFSDSGSGTLYEEVAYRPIRVNASGGPETPDGPRPRWWVTPLGMGAVAVGALMVAFIGWRSLGGGESEDAAGPDVSFTATSLLTTTTAGPTTTTMNAPAPSLPPGLGSFGPFADLDAAGLFALAAALEPYGGTWYPGPDGEIIEPPPPGLVGTGRVRVDLPEGAVDGVEGGVYDLSIFVFDDPPQLEGPAGAFTQVGLGISCTAEPERDGLDGFGAEGWERLHFYGTTGYSAFSVQDGFQPIDEGFGWHDGSTVVIGTPDWDGCWIGGGNFYRYSREHEATDVDPTDYQWLLMAPDPAWLDW